MDLALCDRPDPFGDVFGVRRGGAQPERDGRDEGAPPAALGPQADALLDLLARIPRLDEERYVHISHHTLAPAATVVLAQSIAVAHGLSCAYRWAWESIDFRFDGRELPAVVRNACYQAALAVTLAHLISPEMHEWLLRGWQALCAEP